MQTLTRQLVLLLSLPACFTDVAVGDGTARALCAGAPILAPTSGCVTEVVTASDDLACTITSEGGEVEQELRGTWLRIRHPNDLATTVSVRVLESDPACPEDLTGRTCPRLLLTEASADPRVPCACAEGGFAAMDVAPDGTPRELTSLHPQQELLLVAGATYEVTVCADPEADAYPVCEAAASPPCPGLAAFVYGSTCACLPGCASAADCPVPSTGTAKVTCDGSCLLDCSTGTCPDGQQCVDTDRGSICMW
jgi:hypothetical protein